MSYFPSEFEEHNVTQKLQALRDRANDYPSEHHTLVLGKARYTITDERLKDDDAREAFAKKLCTKWQGARELKPVSYSAPKWLEMRVWLDNHYVTDTTLRNTLEHACQFFDEYEETVERLEAALKDSRYEKSLARSRRVEALRTMKKIGKQIAKYLHSPSDKVKIMELVNEYHFWAEHQVHHTYDVVEYLVVENQTKLKNFRGLRKRFFTNAINDMFVAIANDEVGFRKYDRRVN